MPVEYLRISSLETFYNSIEEDISTSGSTHNFVAGCSFDASSINEMELSDVHADAVLWSEPICPNELYINHGSYIGDGMEHIVDELNKKPTSKRALYSLISQKDISKSDDKPIPSFIIFQASIEGGVLFCTVFFRALEVKNFLRTNLEEIRLNIKRICDNVHHISEVKLAVFVHNAYVITSQNPLKRPQFDMLSQIKIFDKCRNSPNEIADLLREKSQISTVIELDSLRYLLEIITDYQDEIQIPNSELIVNLLNKSIAKGRELQIARTRHSTGEIIDNLSTEFKNILESMAGKFE